MTASLARSSYDARIIGIAYDCVLHGAALPPRIRIAFPDRAAGELPQNQSLARRAAKLVRLLPSASERMGTRRSRRNDQWRAPADYRIICACQHHASRYRWKRSTKIASRAFAVLFSVPLAFAAFDFSTASAALRLGGEPRVTAAAVQVRPLKPLPILTESVRAEFLNPSPQRKMFTLEVVKEQFFRTEIPYGEIIYRQAKRHGVSPELVAAVVHTESDFRPRLVSDKSAQGLMQIVPGTARILGLSNAFDPEQNINAGTRYLRTLMNRFNDQHLALAAYNAGPGNVMRFGGVPPFPETIGYVDKVNARTRMYRQRVRSRYLASNRIMSAAY